jgi:hypothetical protein
VTQVHVKNASYNGKTSLPAQQFEPLGQHPLFAHPLELSPQQTEKINTTGESKIAQGDLRPYSKQCSTNCPNRSIDLEEKEKYSGDILIIERRAPTMATAVTTNRAANSCVIRTKARATTTGRPFTQ